MIPVGLTIASLLADAQTVVTEFNGLILLVAGLSIGVWAVKFTISRVKRLG